MRKNFTLAGAFALALAGAPQGIFAQNSTENNTYLTNRFFDNWFISAGAGAQTLVGEGTGDHSFGKRLTPALSLSAGKWVAPGWALRAKGDCWKVKSYGTGVAKDMNYFNIHADFMADLMSVFGTYRESRIYQLIPYIGVGVARAEGDHLSFSTNAGLINSFRVSPSVSLYLEVSASAFSDDFNNAVYGTKYDGIVSGEIGVTYNFKRRGFRKYDGEAVARANALNAEVNALREQVNNQNNEIGYLKQQLASQPEAVVTEVTEVIQGQPYASVLFDLNSAHVKGDQMLNIATAAEVIRANPETRFVVTGFADKSTGTAEYNLRLSEKRAKAVMNVLTDQFGVNPGQVELKWDGSSRQLFENNSWNRVAIIAPAQNN